MIGTRTIGELTEGVSIAATALLQNRLRSMLTTLGMVIGVMTVIAIVAIVQGLNASFATQISSFGAHTLYVSKWKWLNLSDDWWKMRNRQPIGKKELLAVQHESKLALAIAPLCGAMATVGHADHELTGVSINGTDEQYLATSGVEVGAGRFLVETDVEHDRYVAVLGAEVVDGVFPGESADKIVGQKILIGGHSFHVIGLLNRRGRFLGQSMDNNVLVPYTTFGPIFGSKRSWTLAVTSRPDDLNALDNELTGILRRVRNVPPSKDDDFTINRQEQFLRVYNQLTGALYGVAIGVGLITLIVGGIGIMNIMLVAVHERTREIGVRRALGARRRTILFQFVLESAMVALVGGGLGTLLGLAVAQLVALLSPLAAATTWSATALGFGFSAVVGLLFGSWPAWRAANLDPVEALRYE